MLGCRVVHKRNYSEGSIDKPIITDYFMKILMHAMLCESLYHDSYHSCHK